MHNQSYQIFCNPHGHRPGQGYRRTTAGIRTGRKANGDPFASAKNKSVHNMCRESQRTYGFRIIQQKRFLAQLVFTAGYQTGNFIYFGDVLAAVGNKYDRLVGIFNHFSKSVNINIINLWNILRVPHRHGKRNVFKTIDQFSKISGIFKNAPAPFSGFQIQCKRCIRTCTVKRIFICQGHGFIAELIVKCDLARGRSDCFFSQIGGKPYPVFIKHPATCAGQHVTAFGVFHLYAGLFKNFQSRCVDRQSLSAV